jgi:hypothetical protein
MREMDTNVAIGMTYWIACTVIAFWIAVRASVSKFSNLEHAIVAAREMVLPPWRAWAARVVACAFAVIAVCALYPAGFFAGLSTEWLVGSPPLRNVVQVALAPVVFASMMFLPSVMIVTAGTAAGRLLVGPSR